MYEPILKIWIDGEFIGHLIMPSKPTAQEAKEYADKIQLKLHDIQHTVTEGFNGEKKETRKP